MHFFKHCISFLLLVVSSSSVNSLVVDINAFAKAKGLTVKEVFGQLEKVANVHKPLVVYFYTSSNKGTRDSPFEAIMHSLSSENQMSKYTFAKLQINSEQLDRSGVDLIRQLSIGNLPAVHFFPSTSGGIRGKRIEHQPGISTIKKHLEKSSLLGKAIGTDEGNALLRDTRQSSYLYK